MTKLTETIKAAISEKGSLPLSEYMQICMYDPEHGYYTSGRPIGKDGDFITAPEISQLFGEMIGIWVAERWIQMGQPHAVTLAELGPGRGTMMLDIIRATAHIPGFNDALNIKMIEVSPTLKAIQKERLIPVHKNIEWLDTLDDCPDDNLIVIGNEIFDALICDQIIFHDGHWREYHVTLSNDELVMTPTRLIENPTGLPSSPEDGDIFEFSDAQIELLKTVCEKVSAALFIDYGYMGVITQSTLQALKGHEKVSPLKHCGEADLTTLVAFERLGLFAQQLKKSVKIYSQRDFLFGHGIDVRAKMLASKNNLDMSDQVKRLTDEDQMGTLFKVMEIT